MAQVWFSRPHQLFWLTPSLVRWWSHPSDWKACLVSHASYNRRLIGLFGRLSIRKNVFLKVGLMSLFLSKPPWALNWLAPFCLSFFTWVGCTQSPDVSALHSPFPIFNSTTGDKGHFDIDTSEDKEKQKQARKKKFIMLTSLTPKQRHRHPSRHKQAKWKLHQKTWW